MAKLKTYELTDSIGYSNVLIHNKRLNRATGQADHIVQFRLYVTAENKAAALAAVHAIGQQRATERHLKVAAYPYIDLLREAGYLTDGSVIVTATMARPFDPVASLRPGEAPRQPIVDALPAPAAHIGAEAK